MSDLTHVLKDISALWYDFGGKLNVPLTERESLLRDCKLTDVGKLEKILDKWISNQKSDVTWKKILDVLVACGKNNIATEVKEHLEQQDFYDRYISKDDFIPFYFY